MPSSTLKDLDKIAWDWAEFTDPKDIQNDNILTAYRVKHNFCKNKTCKRNCKGNPFCLTGLGEARLLENLNKPEEDLNIRSEGSFVGLKNLGATCYVNSLLQLWFHNKVFRDAILSWNPMEDPDEECDSSPSANGPFHPKTVVGHLQQLFSLMYYSKCSFIDPTPLIESLRLDTCTQQDAQEFSKLFISLLEKKLKYQTLNHVRNLINNNFRGEYMYITRCCKCSTESVSPSMFYELELNVKGNNTVNECLAEFLREEKLEGPDCYSCAVCQTKEEACRFIKLCSLPPVLNLQLLRFVYDREKGQRKKLKSVVQFPEILDMKDFVQEKGEPMVYILSAVLIHKGPRASSGHFIAYIKDVSSGTWYSFNDETVAKQKGKNLKLEEEEDEGTSKTKAPRVPKGFQSSTDAYMLVYVSENHKPNINEVQLSERLQCYVDNHNGTFEQFCEEIAASKKESRDKQEELLTVYKSLSVDGFDDLNDIDVLSADCLTSWLDNKNEISRPIDNSKLLCSHSQLDPCAVTSAKYVSSAMAALLYKECGGGPQLRMTDVLCKPCVTNNCLILRTKTKTLEESKEITNIMKKRMAVDEPGFYVDKRSLKSWRTKVLSRFDSKNGSFIKACNGSNSNNFVEDSSEPLSDDLTPVSQTPSMSSTKIQSIPYENKEVNEDNGTECHSAGLRRQRRTSLKKRKLNSSVTVPLKEIRECLVLCQRLHMGLIKSNMLNSESSLLNQCKKLRVKLQKLSLIPNSKAFNINRKRKSSERVINSQIVSNEQKDLNFRKTNIDNNVEISQPSERSETVTLKQEDEEAVTTEDLMDSEKAFNEGIMCPHGNLSIDEAERKLVPVRIWEILKQYFPSAPSFPHNAEPCHLCQNLASKDEVVKQLYYESAVNQKKIFSDLSSLRNRPIPGKTEDTIYVLHKQYFHQPWSAFLKSSTRRETGTMVDPPSSLRVDMLLCMHGLMQFSPQVDEDLARMVLVTSQEWKALTSMYTSDHEVTVSSDLVTSPELCESCFLTRLENEQRERLNYDRAKLTIRVVPSSSPSLEEDQDSQETGSIKKRARMEDGSVSPTMPELKKLIIKSSPDVRRSARTRKVPGQKEVTIIVASSLTMRELKQKITSLLAVAPFDQHLFTLEGKELLGDFNTLAMLGILPNTTLHLQVDEPKGSFDDIFEEECSTPTEPEIGFKGTGLLHAY